jgi:phosphomannomutase
VESLLDAGDAAGLASRFGARLQFGTAGLRGELGAGPNRMNRALVRRAAAGLAAYLRARGGRRVVIGYDARHKSREFALDSAAVFAGAGLDALLLPDHLPTPVLAFAVAHLGADAGVMVTASHNPPRDNGYKVYLGDGAQIVPPADADISAAIDAVGPLADVPLRDAFTTLGGEVLEAYLDAATALVPGGPRDICIVYTPMHGVGRDVALELLRRTGFTDVHVVEQQAEPDPDFPTVAFPNPEEPGAIDLAIGLASDEGADLVIALDPDADRLAVAVDGARLTGDQVGCLLADHLLAQPSGDSRDPLVVCSLVSSTLLGRIASAHGAHYERTLTGFKWIVRPAFAHPEWRFVMGYEEALGYSVGELVRDKDGLTAAVAFADLTARLKSSGATVRDALAAFDARYGAYRTAQRSFRIPADEQQAVMARARALPGATDLRPEADVVVVEGAGRRVVVRPSGTEPKLKVYLETIDGDLDALESETRAALELG